jgi:hypothetical protein
MSAQADVDAVPGWATVPTLRPFGRALWTDRAVFVAVCREQPVVSAQLSWLEPKDRNMAANRVGL